ncbi:MAG: ABC transporter ATP-binding protein [Trueperaceae bacterium]|nr:ABC transporter ATP-binding protein [Trueperaceae bacterium]
MAASAISVEGAHFSYGEREVLKGISFEVAPGEVLGFLGPNGAGKSTTIRLLTGQLKPSAGDVRVLGRDVHRDRAQVMGRVGVSFEEKNLYPSMTGEENLRFFARLYGVPHPDVRGLLAQVGLEARARDMVAGYSKGMRQRLMIARALVHDPDVLLLDEPTDGLDPVSAQAVRDVIRARVAAGNAVLLTTHDMHEADELSHRVAFINEGEIYALDTPERLKLAHGTRSVKVRLRDEDGVREESVELDGEASGARIAELMASGDVITIHTAEATLEEVFIGMTGRGLA